jgi:small subunit ribosomal protein S3
MGRKVHPIGFRLGINKRWSSRWFAEKQQYADQLHEDRAIRQMTYDSNPRGSISRVIIERFPNSINITVHTSKPGIVIGRKGANVKALRARLQELTGTSIKLDIQEIEQPDLEASIVAENVAHQLERRISHRRAMQRAISSTMRAGAEGIKVMCAGRLSGMEMSRVEWMREGRVPAQTLRADIDFARAEAATTFGRIGVKVWIYRGDILPEAEQEAEAMDVYVSE